VLYSRAGAGCLAVLGAALACGQAPSPPAISVTVPPASASTTTSASARAAGDPFQSDCGAASAYVPRPAWSGRPPSLPAPPVLPATPPPTDGTYTVASAVRQLRSLLHHDEIEAATITVEGYIVDTNLPRAPACAIHRAGQREADSCRPDVPSFWMADDKAPAPDAPRIRVVGWARSFAVVHDAMLAYRGGDGARGGKPVIDDVLDVDVPYPLPAPGMKLKVTGRYGMSRYVVSAVVSEPLDGVMQFQRMELLEPPSRPAAFRRPIP
jgi:hypothetical protein